jgi:hypothetical protein
MGKIERDNQARARFRGAYGVNRFGFSELLPIGFTLPGWFLLALSGIGLLIVLLKPQHVALSFPNWILFAWACSSILLIICKKQEVMSEG